MRHVFRIALRHIPPRAALYVALIAIGLPVAANAQEPAASVGGETSVSTVAAATIMTEPATATEIAGDAARLPDATVEQGIASTDDATSVSADASSLNGFALDDQMLNRQRGGRNGMVMVAATPQLTHGMGSGNSVTLWDEIAPPSPLPIPVDAAARAAQGNVASYQRK
ncbi:hypothetical protein [Paraburkholderia sp.]|uniref:hypothetical protein n=1 Tax=Paraburkholderia sp. TaxID=1926495 RepID=UPI0023845016|nr:hypothetical protein [Paraburkholderia sp.]MDE1183641.1 hypothetical protein [Paraburkholderia sp.]